MLIEKAGEVVFPEKIWHDKSTMRPKISRKSIGIIGKIIVFAVLSLAAILKPGDSLLPFSLQTVDGVIITVAIEEGRLTIKRSDKQGNLLSVNHPQALLLDFWATWCIPCRAAMPHLDRLYRQFRSGETAKTSKVEFFGIALDRQGEAIVRPFLQKIKLSYPQLCTPTAASAAGLIRSPQEMASAYKVQEIPVVYVFDREGCIVHAHVGFKEDHVTELEKILSSLVEGEK